MSDKFTIRDFLVYFLTGLFLLITVVYHFQTALFKALNLDAVKLEKHSSLIIFVLLPGLYLLGHIIQSIDHLFDHIGRVLCKVGPKIKIAFIEKLLVGIGNFINSYRITQKLSRSTIDEQHFWQNCNKLIVNSLYEGIEYWNLMHTLFEGLSIICVFWTFYFLFSCELWNSLIYLILAIVCVARTHQMAILFIKVVQSRIDALTQHLLSNR